ncbi:hypothetical protein VOLCADRAFT_96335 [Volvox carteri f. nagariensis]|uniref:Calcineurin-like phosphoesterase domain-containing protein n=1 Tax=Volvox carteri f. nagariensis TaxID=3068 RepID=D8U9U5_VOLCA|nr:uncharacterized protein VOLCADRAFT_96335 [Volvox carteri f. nagariensis]EFJ43472.1 hypothetical protein VOLCADRAFT_96335 [Volvox carteri f. nagariensis]|eukprot:XP_002955401.1 hypothetical protein VOLCADRAFT_96335 [Volvox carteri f. nagariensis]
MRCLAQLRRAATAAGLPAHVTPYKCPVPRVIHHRIEHVKPGRLIIVGDVHGTPELFRLLDSLRYNAASDNLILAGDLVNKGPVSLAILDAVPKLGCWAVRGNHDDAVLSAWLQFRAGQPLNPKLKWAQDMTDEQAAVLLGLPFTVSVPEYGITVVHAGLVPGVPIEQQDMWAMYKMRNVVELKEDGGEGQRGAGGQGEDATRRYQLSVPNVHTPPGRAGDACKGSSGTPSRSTGQMYRAVEKAKDGGKAWGALWRGPTHVFFGHDAKRRLQLHPHATGLDTGCVYGGALTAAVMPPLADLRARSPGFLSRLRSGGALSRKDLMVELVAVEAGEVYSAPVNDGARKG